MVLSSSTAAKSQEHGSKSSSGWSSKSHSRPSDVLTAQKSGRKTPGDDLLRILDPVTVLNKNVGMSNTKELLVDPDAVNTLNMPIVNEALHDTTVSSGSAVKNMGTEMGPGSALKRGRKLGYRPSAGYYNQNAFSPFSGRSGADTMHGAVSVFESIRHTCVQLTNFINGMPFQHGVTPNEGNLYLETSSSKFASLKRKSSLNRNQCPFRVMSESINLLVSVCQLYATCEASPFTMSNSGFQNSHKTAKQPSMKQTVLNDKSKLSKKKQRKPNVGTKSKHRTTKTNKTSKYHRTNTTQTSVHPFWLYPFGIIYPIPTPFVGRRRYTNVLGFPRISINRISKGATSVLPKVATRLSMNLAKEGSSGGQADGDGGDK